VTSQDHNKNILCRILQSD